MKPLQQNRGILFRLVVDRFALNTHVSTQNNLYTSALFSENRLWINSDLIHPEAVFMIHGFGHEAKLAACCDHQRLSGSVIQEIIFDWIGGSPALHDAFVMVNPV